MKKEPVVIGQIVAALAMVGMFYPPVKEALDSVGTVAFEGALVTMWTFVTMMIRSRVSPVE